MCTGWSLGVAETLGEKGLHTSLGDLGLRLGWLGGGGSRGRCGRSGRRSCWCRVCLGRLGGLGRSSCRGGSGSSRGGASGGGLLVLFAENGLELRFQVVQRCRSCIIVLAMD